MDTDKIIDGGFLQSAHWMNFQQAIGKKVISVGQGDNSAIMFQHTLPIVGRYFFIPRGPILGSRAQNNIKALVREIVKEANQQNAGWIRIEPQSKADLECIKAVCQEMELIVKKSKKNHEPAQTLMLDLSADEDALLSCMKQKTRYNIRLAEKKGVKVYSSRDTKNIELFCDLVKITAKRDKVTAHPRTYYQNMVKTIPEEALQVYFARYQGKTIAAALVSFAGGVATYQHGASSNEHRNVMAPYLLQWTAIKDAKKRGCCKYDFGGTKIAQDNSPARGAWEGITKFKLGFCPAAGMVNFPGCYDILIDRNRYSLYLVLQALTDIKKKILKNIT